MSKYETINIEEMKSSIDILVRTLISKHIEFSDECDLNFTCGQLKSMLIKIVYNGDDESIKAMIGSFPELVFYIKNIDNGLLDKIADADNYITPEFIYELIDRNLLNTNLLLSFMDDRMIDNYPELVDRTAKYLCSRPEMVNVEFLNTISHSILCSKLMNSKGVHSKFKFMEVK